MYCTTKKLPYHSPRVLKVPPVPRPVHRHRAALRIAVCKEDPAKERLDDSLPVKSTISPLLPKSCRFVPTCSEYFIESFKTYGGTKGLILSIWRLLRCNPFGGKGFDPVKWPPIGLEWIFISKKN